MGEKPKKLSTTNKPTHTTHTPEKNGFLSTIVQHPIISALVILATFIGVWFAVFPRPDSQLHNKVDALTNNGDTFALEINGQEITNSPTVRTSNGISVDYSKAPIIKLPKSRDVYIRVLNKKDFEVDGVSVSIIAPLAATNLNMIGRWEGPMFQFSNSHLGDFNLWRLICDSLPGYTYFNTTTFNISTNFELPAIPAMISIDGSGRRKQDYLIILNF